MREEERPGQEVKWPRSMARMKVETVGQKTFPWRKAANSALVEEERRALEALDVDLEGAVDNNLVLAPRAHAGCWTSCGGVGEHFGARGIDQRPLVVSLVPVMMTVPSLIIWTSYLEKRAMQSSSQSLPMEMREPVVRPSKT